MIATMGMAIGTLVVTAIFALTSACPDSVGHFNCVRPPSEEPFVAGKRLTLLHVAQNLSGSDEPSDERQRVSLVDLIGPPPSPITQMDILFEKQSYLHYEQKIGEAELLKELLDDLQLIEIYLRDDNIYIFNYHVSVYDDLVRNAEADGLHIVSLGNIRPTPDTVEHKQVWLRNLHVTRGFTTSALRMAEISDEWAEKYDKNRLRYDEFVRLLVQKVDAGAYVYDCMSSSERNRFIAGLSRKALDRLMRNYEMLQRAGEVCGP